jgi:NAD(P)H-quinone oxidoreductase subunit 5
MLENLLLLLLASSPLAFLLSAIASWFQPGLRPRGIIQISRIASILGIIVALVLSLFLLEQELFESPLLGYAELGVSLRLDALSGIMLVMISLLGFIILRYSYNYLDGDSYQGTFLGRLTATIASVQLLVISGNLGVLLVAWILTSVSLHRLLIFYRERKGAQLAARKKFIVARLGDACLLIAVVSLYTQFGTGNLEVIFSEIKQHASAYKLEFPALFIALAAILKSAQFPTHGWLIEVMETPTPVSALLHAGLLNAGPFLLIRMAYLINASDYVAFLLIGVGGITALLAALINLTQTSVKTALAYSSVAHMGFSLLVCGLGIYPAAMLHLLAHSFYKAHAFLSSGSVIELLQSRKITSPNMTVNALNLIMGFLTALGIYAAFAFSWGLLSTKEFSLLFIGAIIVMGLSRLFATVFAQGFNGGLLLRTSGLTLLLTLAFFSFEAGVKTILTSQLPEISAPGAASLGMAFFILFLFALAIFLQVLAPAWAIKPFYRAMAVHVRNGFYANALFDRWIGALTIQTDQSREEMNVREASNTTYKKLALKEQLA